MWERLEHLVDHPGSRPVAEVAEALHHRIGASPAMLAAATLEDLLGVAERPNLPGSVDGDRPNWSVALPVPVEALPGRPDARRTLAALAATRARRP
jgi:4-alpha-glucanotransferase